MDDLNNKKYLITTDHWFLAPDGKEYRAAWGNVEILQDSILGVKTNYRSTNWFAKVGCDNKHVIIAGCQIHYCVRCENKPNEDSCITWDHTIRELDKPDVAITIKTPCRIYFAE